MTKSFLKKALVVGSSSAIALSSLMAAAPAFAAAHAVGTNVSSNGTVYFIDPSGAKRPYTSAGAFLSYGFNSWSNVVAASAEDLALPTGSFVPPMDGSLINDNGTVWIMTNGQRAGFTSAANFLGLGYSFANALPGDTSWMVMAANINSTAMAHPAGTLVNDHGTVYLMSNSGKMGIPSLSVFNSWGYSFSKVVVANSYDSATPMSNGVMQARVAGQLSPLGSSVVIPPVTGSVSVSLASDNPGSHAVITNEGLSDLAHFTFYGTGAVTSLNLKRLGVSADASLGNVFLFDGGTRLTDAASVSSGSMVNFSNSNGLFLVNGSKTISVRANLAATAGETLGVQLNSAMSGTNAVSGTPINGNLMTVAGSNSTLATVALGAVTQSGTTNPGPDVTVWQSTATVNTRDVLLTRLALRQIGSIQVADINNFKLFVDGVQVATTANLDANGYVTFNLSKALTSGSRILKVTADVIGGSGRNVEMSLRGAYDISVTDTQYNAGIVATAAAFPLDAGATFSISAGTMTVVKAVDSQSANVTKGASDQSLAKYTFTAYGEPIKVETLRVGVITTGGTVTDHTLRNVRILVNGSQVGSTTNVPAAATFASGSGTSFTTNFTVNPGSPASVEIRGDIVDSEGTDDIAANTVTAVQALLIGGTSANNAVPQVSLGTIDVPTADNTLGNSLTIASGSMSLTQQSTYPDQTVVSPQTAYKIAAFNLTGNSTEAVNLNTLEVDFTGSVDETTVLTDVYLKYGGQNTSVKGTVAVSDNTWSINRVLAVNETMPVEVYASFSSALSTSTIISRLTVTGVTASSGVTTYADTNSDTVKDANGFLGQTITGVANGTITATVDPSTPVAAIVDDNKSVTTAAFRFAAVNDSFTITDLSLLVSDATNVVTVNLKDGASVVASKPGATSLSFNGLSIPVAANSTKVLTVELVLGSTGVGAGTSGASIQTSLAATGFTARSSGGTSDVSGNNAGPSIQAAQLDGSAMYVYKAIPTIASVTLPSPVLAAGTNTLAKFSITPNGGPIAWDRIIFSIAKTSAPVLANGAAFTVWNADTNTQVGGTATVRDTADAATCIATLLACRVQFVATNEQQISAVTNYVLKANVTGTLVATDYISTSIAAPSVYAAPNDYATVAASGSFAQTYAGYGTSPSFIWSDVSANSHATTTSDWNNDYQVRFLPLDSQTLTK